MTTTMWIDRSQSLRVGDAGFLVRIGNATTGIERYELRARPPTVNHSQRPMPRGWCGSWNDVSSEGLGIWRVVEFARDGRAQIAEVLDPDELASFLNEYGYPDLLDACLPATTTI
jgi:hypothetical protein